MFRTEFDNGGLRIGANADGQGNPGLYIDENNYFLLNRGFKATLEGNFVQTDNIIASINASPEGVAISGSRIELNGDTSIDGSFTVSGGNVHITADTVFDADVVIKGTLDGVDGTFSGTLSGGNISGPTITGSTITGGVIKGSSFEVNNGDFWDDTGHFRFGGAQGIRYAGNDVLIGSGVSIDGDVDLVGRIRIGSVEGVSIGLDSSGLSLGYNGEVTFGLASAGTFSGLRWHSPEFGDSYDGFDIFAGSDIRLRPFGDVIIGSASTGFVHINRLGTIHGAFTDPIPMSVSGSLNITQSNRLIVQINPSGSYNITTLHYSGGVSAGRVLILVNGSSSHTLTCTQSSTPNGFARNLTIRPGEMVWVVRMGSQWVGNST